MNITKEEALKLWDELYLKEERAYDYASHPMKREDYENKDSIYGWTIDLKQPNLTAGKNAIDNYIPASIVTKNIRENKTSFKVGSFLFEVRKGKRYGEYDIYDITNKNNPINMEPSDENQELEYNRKRRHQMTGKTYDLQDENQDEKIDQQLKAQRLAEKIEKENYKPTEEEVKQIEEAKVAEEEIDSTIEEPVVEDKITEVEPIVEPTIEESTIEETSNNEQIVEEMNTEDNNVNTFNETISEPEVDKVIDDEIVNESTTEENINEQNLESDSNAEEVKDITEENDTDKCLNCKKLEDANKLIAENVEENNNLKDNIATLKDSRIDDQILLNLVRDELVAYKEERENLEKELEKLQEENNNKVNLENNNDNFIEKEQNLNNEIQKLKETILELENKNLYIQEEKDKLEKTNEDINTKLSNLIDSQKDDQILLNLVRDELVAYKEEKENLERKLETIKEQEKNINDDIEVQNDLKEKEQQLEEEINKLKETISSLESSVSLKDEENKKLTTLVNKKIDKISELTLLFYNLKDELLGYKNEKDNLLKENEKLLSEIDESSHDSQNEELLVKNEELNSKIEEVDEKIELLSLEYDKLKEENSNLFKVKTELEDENRVLKLSNDSLLKANEQFVSDNKELKRQNGVYETVKVEQEEKNKNSNLEYLKQIEELTNTIKNLEEKNNELVAFKNELIKVNETLTNNSSNFNDKDIALIEENTALDKTNRNIELENKKLKEENQNNERTISEMRVVLDSYLSKEDHSDELEKELNAKESRINELLKQLEDEKNKQAEKEIIEKIVYDDSAYLENLYVKEGGDPFKYEDFDKLYKKEFEDYNDDNIIALLRKYPEYILKPKVINKVVEVDDLEVIENNKQLVKTNKDLVKENNDLKNKIRQNIVMLESDSLLTRDSLLKSVQEFLKANKKLKEELNSKTALANKNEESLQRITELEEQNNLLKEENAKLQEQVTEEQNTISVVDERQTKAETYFKLKFGVTTHEAVDFAGNYIRFGNYLDASSDYGWNYILFDENKEDTIDNVLIASINSLRNFTLNESFEVNNKNFIVKYTDDNLPYISCEDYIADPEIFTDALSISSNTAGKKFPLVYLFVRFKGVDGDEINVQNAEIFSNLIDLAVRKNYKNILLNVKQEKDYVYLTFDGENPNTNQEVLRLATLINSYRRSLSSKNMIDAVIVLDQINCYKYLINYSFKSLLKNTNDADMRAIKYQLLNSPVISSTIKSTIHIGSNIINNGLDLSGKKVYKSDFASDEFKEMCRSENPDIDDVYFAEYRYLLWKD